MGGYRRRFHDLLRHLALPAALLLAFAAGGARAQVVMDGTLGAPGALSGPNYAITNTLGTQVGANLFHSFSQFSLVSGNIATFSGLPGTANIIGRVTGGSASSIDGTLRSTISGANLWLINPSGMAFGPNARLDLRGSFHASTASYLKLGANGRFDAANPSASVLTVDAPSSFGFLGAAAPITLNHSQLGVPAGASISFDGGDFTMNGGILQASSFSTADAGDISIRGANISIVGGALIDTSAIALIGGSLGGGRAGTITIEATGDMLLSGGSRLTSITFLGSGPAGDTRITARNMTISDRAGIKVSTFGDGAAGNVSIAVRNLALSGGGRIDANSEFDISSTPGTGAGGRIDVRAAETVAIAGEGSGLFSKTSSLGPGGTITVAARDISVTDGGRISARSEDPFNIGGIGDSGSINLNATGSIRLQGGAAVTTQSVTADGGAITIRAVDTLALTDSRITTSVLDDSGNGGAINIDPIFVILNNSQILAQAQNGNGGNITIVSDFLMVSPDSFINATSRGGGVSGTILITAPGSDVGTRLAALPASYVDAASLLREACAARAVGNSFTGVGRGGLPATPGAAAYAAYGFGTAQFASPESAPLLYSRAPNLSASVLPPCPG